jgi:uncharacterized cupredoxin-like copper-binding protein
MIGVRATAIGALVTLGVLVPVGCGSGSDDTVDIALADYSITPKSSTKAAGNITFKVHNGGTFVHELVVFKVAKASDIPTTRNGEVNEEGVPEAARMGEVEDVQPGASKSLKLKLSAGKYVLFCNRVDGTKVHFHEGMHTEFTVT